MSSIEERLKQKFGTDFGLGNRKLQRAPGSKVMLGINVSQQLIFADFIKNIDTATLYNMVDELNSELGQRTDAKR